MKGGKVAPAMDEMLLKQVWPVFRLEAAEQMAAIRGGVAALAGDLAQRPPDLLESVKRSAHSLKGSAGSLGVLSLVRVAHQIEELLSSRAKDAALGADGAQAVGDALVAIESIIADVDGGGSGEISGLDAVLDRLVGQIGRPTKHQACESLRRDVRGLTVLLTQYSSRADLGAESLIELVPLASGLKANASANGLPEVATLAGDLQATLRTLSTRPTVTPQQMALASELLVALDRAISAGSME